MVKTPFREFKATVSRINCHLQTPYKWGEEHKNEPMYYDCNVHLSDDFHRKKYREFLFSKRSPFIGNNYDEIILEGVKTSILHLASSHIDLGEWKSPLECVSSMKKHSYESPKRNITCKKVLSFGEWVGGKKVT